MKKQGLSSRWYLWAIALLLLVVLLLPTFFSTSVGTKVLLSIIKGTTSQEIQVDKLSLSWLGPQKASNITVKDDKRNLLFHAAQAETDASLFGMIHFNESLKVHKGELKFLPPDQSPIVFNEIEILIHVPKKEFTLIFTITGKTAQGGSPGSFNIKGEIANLETSQPLITLQADANNFPVQGIDQILDLEGLLVTAIGPTIDLHLRASTAKESVVLNFQAQSEQLTAHIDTIAADETLLLKSPAKVSLLVTPSLIKQLSPLTLNASTKLELTVQRLSCPFTDVGLNLAQLSFLADLDLAPSHFEEFTLTSLKAKLFSEKVSNSVGISFNATSPQFTLSHTELTLANKITLNDPTIVSYKLNSGEEVSFKLNSLMLPFPIEPEKMQLQADLIVPSCALSGSFSVNTWENISFLAKGANFQTSSIEARYKNEILAIKTPFSIHYALTNNTVESHLPKALLLKTAEINIEIQPTSLPIKDLAIEKLRLQGKASVDELLFASRNASKQFPVKNAVLQFTLDAPAQSANAAFTSVIGEGNCAVDFTLQQFDLENSAIASLTANAKIDNLSTSFIDTLLTQNFDLQTLFGNAVNLNIQLESSPAQQHFHVKARTPLVDLVTGFVIQDNMLKLTNEGLNFNFTITKESYPLLDSGPFKLQQSALCSLRLDQLTWPLIPTEKAVSLKDRFPEIDFDWNQIRLKGNMYLKEADYQQFALSNMQLHFDKSEEISFSLSSALSPQGQIAIVGQVPITNASQIKIDGAIDNFPTIILDLFARFFGKSEISFVPVFGKTLNAKIVLDLQNFNGPLSLDINSENTKAYLAGQVNGGILTLHDPLYAQVLMTPELSALLFKQMDPLSIKEITSKSPITLEINPAGFVMPIQNFDPNKVFISKARLGLGKLTCRNEGNINIALGLLKWGKKEENLKLWFAPCDFRVKAGEVSIERTEILIADTFDVALWGNISLPNRYVDMVLGLTAPALSKAFSIKDLPKDYVLQIPMRGPMDNVSIDSGKATTKIALLMAWQQKSIAGALGGGIFGGLAGKVIPLPDFDSKAPPAKHPFPWETPQKEHTSHAIKKGDKPLKQLLKLLY